MTITLRSETTDPLTWNQLDENFVDLNTRTAEGWRDNIVMLVPQPGNPESPELNIFRQGIHAYNFAAGQNTEACAYFHVDHDYAMGTALYPHVHWAIQSGETGTIRWGVEYTIAKGHQQMAFGETTTVYVEQASTGTPYMHYIAEVNLANAIPGTNIEPDTLILCRFFRDGAHPNDTLAADAFVFCVDLHYQADRATTPNKTVPFV